MKSLDLLIDADMYLYQAAQACEVETDWGGDKWTLHSDAGSVRRLFRGHIDQFMDTLHGNRAILCFSDPSRASFRKELDPTYKQHRRKRRKPLAYAAVRDQLSEAYKIIIKPRLEADDVMGIVATRAPGQFIIVSGDKDMEQIPGLWSKGGSEVIEVLPLSADAWFWTQCLTGDVTDGYPGCPGIGEKKAADILAGWRDAADAWKRIVGAYNKAGLTEADAQLQARLARILRNTDWDFDKSEVKLWTPPGRAA